MHVPARATALTFPHPAPPAPASAIEVAPGHGFEKTAVFWAYGPTALPVTLVPA